MFKKMAKVVFLVLCVLMLGSCGSNGESTKEPTESDLPDSEITGTETADPNREYVKPEMKGEITIGIYSENDFLNDASRLFMDKYPDVTVTINEFKGHNQRVVNPETNAVTTAKTSEEDSIENYLTYLNTLVMTGKADDIISTTEITVKRYTDMGVFEDLTFYMKNSPEINSDSHFMNIFDIMIDNKGRMYEFPLTSTPNFIVSFNKELADSTGIYLDDSIKNISYGDALEYASQLYKASGLTITSPGGNLAKVMGWLVYDKFEHYVDMDNKKSNFDNAEFVALLNSVEDMAEFNYFQDAYSINTSNPWELFMSVTPDSPYLRHMPLGRENGVVYPYRYQLNLGINSKAENKELLWEFMKFLVTDDIQTLPSLYNSGVNKKSLDTYIDQSADNAELIAPAKEKFTEWISQINTYRPIDMTIETFLYEELYKYSDGEQTAEETAASLQRKIDKYLNE